MPYKFDDARYAGFPNYLFGIHDSGGESFMLAAGKPGWIVSDAQVNPSDSTGDFSRFSDKGFGVIVCLYNGVGAAGTLPDSKEYDDFARSCAEYVGKSRGARIWVIGNEPNASASRHGNDGSPGSGELITPQLYAKCFVKTRRAIRSLPGHENDWVVPAAVAPFNSSSAYGGNPSGDWVRYFADILFQITSEGGNVDALALHSHTHGYDSNFVSSDAMAGDGFDNRHWHFRAYRDFLAAVPPTMRKVPVFITAARPLDPGWTNANRGWIQAACAEINTWNNNPANQPVQGVCFYRWQASPGDPTGWGISDKPQVVNDYRAALQNDYRLRWPGAPPTPDYRANWVNVINVPLNAMNTNEVITGRVVVKNSGVKAWLATGSNPVRLGCLWYNREGIEIRPVSELQNIALPQNILPGQTAVIENVKLTAPPLPGEYTVRFDLLQEGRGWFSAYDSPTRDLSVTVNAPIYASEWTDVPQVPGNTIAINSTFTGTIAVKNTGSRTWFKKGPNPVRLGYRWYNGQGAEIPISTKLGNFEMEEDTPPGSTAHFRDVSLTSPQSDGTYVLRWDLIQEGVTWFNAQGVETYDQTVNVFTPIPDYAVKWVNIFVDVRGVLEPNETVSGTITVQNIGAQTWPAVGVNAVRLGYHWFDSQGTPVAISPYPGNLPLQADVPPQGTATFENVIVRAPIPQGKYTLSFDLVQENVTWFSATGSKPFDVQVSIKTDAPAHLAQWEGVTLDERSPITAGEDARARVVIKNTGAEIWQSDGDSPVRLGYNWYDASGIHVDITGSSVEIPLPQDVAPRESIAVDNLVIHTPDAPGDFILKFDLIGNDNEWFSDNSGQTGDLNVHLKPPPPEWGAEFLAHDSPASLVVGQAVSVNLSVLNNGRQTWKTDGANPVHAGYKWFNASGIQQFNVQDHRTALPAELAPGEQLDFAAALAAPQTPGAYRLHWDLVAEGISWFTDGGNQELIIPVKVTSAPTATTSWRAESSHNPSTAILTLDGDLTSFWSGQSPQSLGMWFRVNLGEPVLIDGIAFRSPGEGYPVGYTIRVSEDGQVWHTVGAVAQGNTRDVVASFAPTAVRYAQMDLVAPSENEWMISEVQIHPAAPWSATASLNAEQATNAIDGSPASAWTTGEPQSPNIWFQLDLGRVESVSALQLISSAAEIPMGYRVSAWNQLAGGWQKISERYDNTEPINITFAPIQTQYLNIQLLQSGDTPWAIRELRVTKAMTEWIGPTNS